MHNAVDYRKFKIERLKDSEYAKGYLQTALEEYYKDKDSKSFLTALKDIALAKQGMSKLAEGTGKNRQSLYKALSIKGNPTLETLNEVLVNLGYRFEIVPFVEEE